MKREQLTNVTTESIDQRCNMLAWESMAFSQALVDLRRSPHEDACDALREYMLEA